MVRNPPLKNQTLREYAESVAHRLLVELAPYPRQWRYGSWKRLNEAITDEGESVRMGSPAGIAVYAQLIGIAAIYLNDYFRSKAAEELITNVRHDIDRFEKYHTNTPRAYFTDDERQTIERSLKEIKEVVRMIEDTLQGRA